jgi:hypothetical protein
LAGVIENYFIEKNLPYSINAEMKIYADGVANQRCDLTIHEVPSDFLYLHPDSHKQSLKVVIEIKYANAVHPDFEFSNGAILADLVKLSSIKSEVLKYLVVLDEANRISEKNCDWLIEQCSTKNIELFSNNTYINFQQGFPYGYRDLFVLSKQDTVSNAEYVFAQKDWLLERVKECFDVIKITPTYFEIKLDEKSKADFFYAGEFDEDVSIIKGNCIIDVKSDFPINHNKIKDSFREFIEECGASLYLMKEDENQTYKL